VSQSAHPSPQGQAFAEWWGPHQASVRAEAAEEAAQLHAACLSVREHRKALLRRMEGLGWGRFSSRGGKWTGWPRENAPPPGKEVADPSPLGKIANSDSAPRSGGEDWERKYRRFEARAALRDLAPWVPSWDGSGAEVRGRVGRCGCKRIGGEVQLHAGAHGVSVVGVERCGSIHACPVCAPAIYAERAEEVRRLVTQFGEDRTVMLTLTIKHDRWASLHQLEMGIRAAWRAFWAQGRASMGVRRVLGVVHYVRAIEHTHGEHGWHPHFHLVLILREGHRLTEADRDFVATHWAACVRRVLGTRYEPTQERGATLTSASEDTYIVKLGLEIAGITSKSPKHPGHLTSWQVAQRAAEGDERYARLWAEYVRETKGVRLMTWSRGTKRLLGLEEKTDEQITAEEAERDAHRYLIASFDGDAWDAICRANLDVAALRAATDGDLGELIRLGAMVRAPPGEAGGPHRGSPALNELR
jgi:hypothetical protein